MNALERHGTAPFMRQKGSDYSAAPVHMFSAAEDVLERGDLFERLVHARAELFREWLVYAPAGPASQWGVREWGTGEPFTLVYLGATGATMIAPQALPHVTAPYSVLRSLPAELEGTYEALDALKELGVGWNGHDVAAPKIEAIHDATEWIGQMYEEVLRARLVWHKPHVAADENGDVTFEWWNGDKGLTIYVSADGSVSYLKDWGLDMNDEMEVGSVSTPEQRHDIWAWFVQQ